jgi:hypothetical protein
MVCPGGGIGRHAGLKILCPLGRAGSSPAPGTEKGEALLHLFCKQLSGIVCRQYYSSRFIITSFASKIRSKFENLSRISRVW